MIVTFFFQKLKTELRNLQINKSGSSHTIALSKGTIFKGTTNFLQKYADISKIKRALVVKGIFSETTYMCV